MIHKSIKGKLEPTYNKYRIYATEIYRNIFYGKLPRSITEVKKEYNVPDATTVTKRLCFIHNKKYRMLNDEEIRDIIVQSLADKLKTQKFKSILEIGCGSGRNLTVLKKMFPDKKMYGLDIAEQMVKEAKINNPSIKFFCCSASKIPFADNSIDVIFSVHAIEQMTAVLPFVIAELKRVCKDRIILMEPFPEVQNWIGVLHNKRLGYPMDVYSRVLSAGFQISCFKALGFGNPINKTGLLIAEQKQ